MIENKDEIMKELREILNKNRINTEEERELYFFKLRDLENKAIYYKDDETRELLYGYEKSMLDKTSSFLSAYERGFKEGLEKVRLEKGKLEGKKETIKSALEMGMDMKAISILTKLTIIEVEAIVEELNDRK